MAASVHAADGASHLPSGHTRELSLRGTGSAVSTMAFTRVGLTVLRFCRLPVRLAQWVALCVLMKGAAHLVAQICARGREDKSCTLVTCGHGSKEASLSCQRLQHHIMSHTS